VGVLLEAREEVGAYAEEVGGPAPFASARMVCSGGGAGAREEKEGIQGNVKGSKASVGGGRNRRVESSTGGIASVVVW
jgi:hypothetical protein